jgi:hypothetical protein
MRPFTIALISVSIVTTVVITCPFVVCHIASTIIIVVVLALEWEGCCVFNFWEPSAASHSGTPFFNDCLEGIHEIFVEGIINGAWIINQDIFFAVVGIQYGFL